jgi:hypothetical protein
VIYVPENINASKNLVDNSEEKGPHESNWLTWEGV